MWLLASDAPPSSDAQTAIILGVIGLLTAVLVAVATGVFSLLSARANRTSPSAPPPTGSPSQAADLAFRDYVVGELAVNRKRDDDHDDARDIVDRRLDQIERHLDLENPEWRHDGR